MWSSTFERDKRRMGKIGCDLSAPTRWKWTRLKTTNKTGKQEWKWHDNFSHGARHGTNISKTFLRNATWQLVLFFLFCFAMHEYINLAAVERYNHGTVIGLPRAREYIVSLCRHCKPKLRRYNRSVPFPLRSYGQRPPKRINGLCLAESYSLEKKFNKNLQNLITYRMKHQPNLQNGTNDLT